MGVQLGRSSPKSPWQSAHCSALEAPSVTSIWSPLFLAPVSFDPQWFLACVPLHVKVVRKTALLSRKHLLNTQSCECLVHADPVLCLGTLSAAPGPGPWVVAIPVVSLSDSRQGLSRTLDHSLLSENITSSSSHVEHVPSASHAPGAVTPAVVKLTYSFPSPRGRCCPAA